jgi:hypothetical protein
MLTGATVSIVPVQRPDLFLIVADAHGVSPTFADGSAASDSGPPVIALLLLDVVSYVLRA